MYTPRESPMLTDINTSSTMSKENETLKNITTVYKLLTINNSRLNLYMDIHKIGFIDYKIKDELLKKIYINQISIDAYYQRHGLGTYLIECLKKEFDTIGLLSISKSLNVFYEKNHFEEDLLKTKLRNNTNYVWTK